VNCTPNNHQNAKNMISVRYFGFDLLRGIAAFGIVGCHLSLEPKTIGGDIVTSLCDFNVGLFAAVAGFLMCGVDDHVSWLSYVRKRFWRLLPIYFLWSLVYLCLIAIFDILFDGGHLNPRYHTLGFWLSAVFWGRSASQLWFLPSLFYAQILTAAFFHFGGKQRHGFLWFLFGGVLILCSAGLECWYGRYPLRLLAFLVTGYGIGIFVKPHVDVLKRYSLIIMGVAIVALGLHIWLRDSIKGFYKDWIAVGPVLLSFVALDFRSCQVKQVALTLGATSMGVYLVHPLPARILSLVVGKLVSPPYTAAVIAADWVIVWGLTMLTVLLMRRIPLAKKFL